MPIHKKQYRYWTQQECDILINLYGTVPVQEIADKVDRTVEAVHNKSAMMGLQKRDCKRWTLQESYYAYLGATPEGRSKRAAVCKKSRLKKNNIM